MMPEYLLRTERVQEFIEGEGGKGTDYVCWETFYGVLAPLTKIAVGNKVVAGFKLWGQDLARAVGRANRSSHEAEEG